ncbi:MAG: hypothetical protein K1Y02_13280 [Candidatus Hydrogenedentes bacterium]|nr:hypothetical protein [Candidatus Hydrogenedentota bacterium]
MTTKKRTKEKDKPVQEIRLGKIKAAIWANDTDKGVRYNVTVSRLYRDGQTWKNSSSFGRDDLLLASKVLDRAHSWIIATTQKVQSPVQAKT